MKWLIILLLAMNMAHATVTVEYSTDNITWSNITHVDETTKTGYQIALDENTLYYIRGKNATTDWTYLEQRTDASGEKSMASLGIIIFVSMITAGVFLAPRLIGQMSKNAMLDIVLRGLCYVMGFFLLALDTTIALTIADTFELGVHNELVRYLWLVSWSSYLGMVIVILRFGYDALQLMNNKRLEQRYGYNEE